MAAYPGKEGSEGESAGVRSLCIYMCEEERSRGVHKLGASEHNYLSKDSKEVVVQERGVWE